MGDYPGALITRTMPPSTWQPWAAAWPDWWANAQDQHRSVRRCVRMMIQIWSLIFSIRILMTSSIELDFAARTQATGKRMARRAAFVPCIRHAWQHTTPPNAGDMLLGSNSEGQVANRHRRERRPTERVGHTARVHQHKCRCCRCRCRCPFRRPSCAQPGFEVGCVVPRRNAHAAVVDAAEGHPSDASRELRRLHREGGRAEPEPGPP